MARYPSFGRRIPGSIGPIVRWSDAMRLSCRLVTVGLIGTVALAEPGGSARAQQVAGSVESGLQSLAQEIVTKSVAQDRNSIAVLPFPNADGSCSVLSTYIADELIEALFSIQNSPLTIIERNQLEAIVNEIQIGAGGLLNPETTQSLGKVSGVKALTVGTITQIGDRIRITARLVATDTGRTISAAAVSIPRTGDVDSLLRQPVAGEGGTCGVHFVSKARPSTGSDSSTPAFASQVSSTAGTGPAQVIRAATIEGLTITAQTVTRSADRKTLTIVLTVVNTEKGPTKILMTRPKPSILDDETNYIEVSTVNGIQICNDWGLDANGCKVSYQVFNWTTLMPAVPNSILLRFTGEGGKVTGKTLSFTATMLKMPLKEDGTLSGSSTAIADVPISFSNLIIKDVGGR